MPTDLTSVIEDSMFDAGISESAAAVDTAVSTDFPETPETSTEASEGTSVEAGDTISTDSTESSDTPAEPAQDPATSAMDQRLGIASHTNGRENRIPYSRVKKIVEGAEKKAIQPLQAKLGELEPKVKEYETRLQEVAQFEQVLTTDVDRTLQMLATLPAWQPFFAELQQLVQQRQAPPAPAASGEAPVAGQPQAVGGADPMPEPTEDDGQGGKVYSMAGVQQLMGWATRNAKAAAMEEMEKRYAPIRQEYEANQRTAQLVPVINKQIADARTWEKFTENEGDIVKFLNENPQASLETAYRAVVVPKLKTDVAAIRKQVLSELQKAPVGGNTSMGGTFTKVMEQAPAPGTRKMEDVILQAMREKGLK